MIKRVISVSVPAYISVKNSQLLLRIKKPASEEPEELTFPIEDIGVLLIDNAQISLSTPLLTSMLENNCVTIVCNEKHMPAGLMLPISLNSNFTEVFRKQIKMTQPLKKKLWAQTVSQKILNQGILLSKIGKNSGNMMKWAQSVRSGDPTNLEGRAAVYYWKNLFSPSTEFTRDPEGLPPNNLLNYGYAILRAIVARGLVSSGLQPSLGLFHSNKYNPFCLADDIMEPYRIYVDESVYGVFMEGNEIFELSKDIKKKLLGISSVDVIIEGKRSPLMVDLQRTTSSLVDCIFGKSRKILYPDFVNETQ